jgi:hypothetical protein
MGHCSDQALETEQAGTQAVQGSIHTPAHGTHNREEQQMGYETRRNPAHGTICGEHALKQVFAPLAQIQQQWEKPFPKIFRVPVQDLRME